VTLTPFEQNQKNVADATYAALVALGGRRLTDQSAVAYHDGTQIHLPSTPVRMTEAEGAKILAAAAKNLEMEHNFNRTFRFRPWDGANALQLALKKVFGTTGEGAATMTMFGPQPPEYIQVEVDVDVEIAVPWGKIDFPILNAQIYVGETYDKRFGNLFQLSVIAPKKHQAAIEGLFIAVEMELKQNSIYKGKAFVGVDKPQFLNPFKVDREKVVYADDVFTRLENSVWGPIRTADMQRAENLALNSKVVLHGPYGTGKTLALTITAQEAVREGWTFIQCHTGKDKLESVMQTAQLYAPCVVGIEDIDVLASAGDEKEVSKLLELFDGIGSKGSEIMVVMTSNQAAELHKGMLRAGRVDATIEIGALDEAGVERLIRVSIPDGKLDENIEWARVHKAMEGYEPAFIKETFVSAQRAAVVRTDSRQYLLTTEDFEAAALLLRPQHDLHGNAKTKPAEPTLDQLFRVTIADVVQNHRSARELNGQLVEVEQEG